MITTLLTPAFTEDKSSFSTKKMKQLMENSAASIKVNLYYIQFDYPVAVQNGKIIDQIEFDEQVALTKDVIKDVSKLEIKSQSEILNLINSLTKKINSKSRTNEINRVINLAINLLNEEFPTSQAPPVWPSLAEGKKLYSTNCLNCHGVNGKGDGPQGKNLNPKPINFHKRASNGPAPFNYFLSISHGINGTGMTSFKESLTSTEIWDLAHYVYSFKLKKRKSFDKDLFFRSYKKLTLYELAQKNDEAVIEIVKDPQALSMLRFHSVDSPLEHHLIIVKVCLELAQEAYSKKENELAKVYLRKVYYEGLESIEQNKKNHIKYQDSKLILKGSLKMINANKSLKELKLNNQLILKKLGI
jgi:high-affinity iron transporter